MPFLDPPFQHDVFVSYAHGRTGRFKTWTEDLVGELKKEILDFGTDFGGINIFIDTQLDPARPLTAQLRDKVRASGLLLVIMTSHYLESSWCGDELSWFEQEIGKSASEGGLVLVVRAQPTEPVKWPACLKDERGYAHLGFPFHTKPKVSDPDPATPIRPYGWPRPNEHDDEFYKELARLSTVVIEKLREIRGRRALLAPKASAPLSVPGSGERGIYLQGSIAQEDAWQQTKSELEQIGCKVWPERLTRLPGGDLMAMEAAREERLRILSRDAGTACLVRSSQVEEIEPDIKMLASDRSALKLWGKPIRCGIIDRVGGELPFAKRLGFETVDAVGASWHGRFLQWIETPFRGPL